uniref:Uncharacterized protein n=1 Tax=Arundo donax TaxID=35708 RepID=A0A0A8ZC23_ARUDO
MKRDLQIFYLHKQGGYTELLMEQIKNSQEDQRFTTDMQVSSYTSIILKLHMLYINVPFLIWCNISKNHM